MLMAEGKTPPVQVAACDKHYSHTKSKVQDDHRHTVQINKFSLCKGLSGNCVPLIKQVELIAASCCTCPGLVSGGRGCS